MNLLVHSPMLLRGVNEKRMAQVPRARRSRCRRFLLPRRRLQLAPQFKRTHNRLSLGRKQPRNILVRTRPDPRRRIVLTDVRKQQEHQPRAPA